MTARVDADKINFHCVSQKQCADIFGESTRTIKRWVAVGCPQNPDNTYNTTAVFNWYCGRLKDKLSNSATPKDLVTQKMQKEIEYKDAQINKIMSKMVERTFHEQVMVSRASSLRQFLEKSMAMNAIRFTGLTIEEARTRLIGLVKKMMDAYTGGEENIDDSE